MNDHTRTRTASNGRDPERRARARRLVARLAEILEGEPHSRWRRAVTVTAAAAAAGR